MKGDIGRASDRCGEIFSRQDVQLTLGGEPTYVPVHPQGPEWSYAAGGPTKLGFARQMASCLLEGPMSGGIDFFCPGKSYPGEVNPRWAIKILLRRDGSPVLQLNSTAAPTAKSLARFKKSIVQFLAIDDHWVRFSDERSKSNKVWVLLLDEVDQDWKSFPWTEGPLVLNLADGPAGLRLPLHQLPPDLPRRALTVEFLDGNLSLFLPPVVQDPFVNLLGAIEEALNVAGIGQVALQGYVPADDAGQWIQLGLAADPGVLEVNLPVCADWREYDYWIRTVTVAAEASGLRSWKQFSHPEGTGGGNHLLWGGPTTEGCPFFTRPGWLTSILRYWQHHPSLSYLFTGCYVGASSQAPRSDESARSLHDLELAWTFLESLGPGDHRTMISETLRHLQTDVTGNSHRSEISLDKFWNVGWPAGTLGLLEFRAIESLPKAEWMSAVALLWTSLAAWLLECPFRKSLRNFAARLHDEFFLPTFLWHDLSTILDELREAGFPLPAKLFRQIWDWKFPSLLKWSGPSGKLTIRQAHESWPLLCETPVDGGTTSRFVDTSMQRLEILADLEPDSSLLVNNRPLPLQKSPDGSSIAGLRFRRTNLYPSLHPGLPTQLPLTLSIVSGHAVQAFSLSEFDSSFRPIASLPAQKPGPRCKPSHPGGFTCDLRIP